LVAHANRKRQVGQAIPVQVAELAATDAELNPSEAMRFDGDAAPAGDFAFDLC
jgi:hypothetical protein